MHKRYPNLKFEIDKEYDYWTCEEFLTYDPNDMFSKGILKIHPELEKVKDMSTEERKIFFKEYIDSFYKTHEGEINKVKENSKTEWEQVEIRFYTLVDKYFGTRNEEETEYIYFWPEGKYVCALSIFNCNPRDIENKDFQAYYKHSDGVKYVAVHEMLHFALYDYVEKNLPKMKKELGDKGMWKLSEVFNDVILRDKKFVEITGVGNPGIYAQNNEELCENLSLWKKAKQKEIGKPVDNFLQLYK